MKYAYRMVHRFEAQIGVDSVMRPVIVPAVYASEYDALLAKLSAARSALIDARKHLEKGAQNVGDPFTHVIAIIDAALGDQEGIDA